MSRDGAECVLVGKDAGQAFAQEIPQTCTQPFPQSTEGNT